MAYNYVVSCNMAELPLKVNVVGPVGVVGVIVMAVVKEIPLVVAANQGK